MATHSVTGGCKSGRRWRAEGLTRASRRFGGSATVMAAGGRVGTLRFQPISQAATPAVFVRPSESLHGLESRDWVFSPETALFPRSAWGWLVHLGHRANSHLLSTRRCHPSGWSCCLILRLKLKAPRGVHVLPLINCVGLPHTHARDNRFVAEQVNPGKVTERRSESPAQGDNNKTLPLKNRWFDG